MAAYRARIKEFHDVLNEDQINLKRLKSMCFNGIPDEPGSVRALCWKLILNYLPLSPSKFLSFLEKQRKLYSSFIQEMIVNPGKQHFGKSGKIDVTFEDHPLNPNPDSQWVAYFKDNDVLVQIDKDVRRLCPDIGFFQRATEFPCQDVVNAAEMETLRKRVDCSVLQSHTVMKNRQGAYNWKSSKKSTVEYDLLPDGKEAHWEVVERILFIYAKLNPGLAYVQGMNEIIGPIYYIFASDSEREWSEHAECDAFFCFTNLMSEIRDNFIKSLDDSAHGIGNMMMQLMNRLQLHDPDVGSLMVTQDLKPQYFSFRWLTLLLSQEFPMPDVIRVWDSLFADSKRFDFLIDVCLAMLLLIRDDLLKNDFSSNMKLLQRYPVFDIHLVLSEAVRLQKS